MVRNVTLTIDHKSVTVPENTTILEAARSVNINIPTLCYLKAINEIGACRICCVEVEGMERLVPACDNVVADGMVVFTNSAKAREARRMNLRLILSNHDTSCTNCTRSGVTRRWTIPHRSFAKTISVCNACAASRCAKTCRA